MAGTLAQSRNLSAAEVPTAAATNGVPAEPRRSRTPKALALTDTQGRYAIVWRQADAWVVECDDPAFKRRIQRALRKPVWIREDAPGSGGERWSRLVELRPSDPRHAPQLFWNWHQLGLRDVEVTVVPAPAPSTSRRG